MTRHKMATIEARFASSVWTHPTTGEERLYVNGIDRAAKVYVTRDAGHPGGYAIRGYWRDAYQFTFETACAAVENACTRLNLPRDVNFDGMIEAAIN